MLGKPRPIQVALFEAPQHQAIAEPTDNAGGKPGRCGGIFLISAASQNFMQRTERQPATRQRLVNRINAERQHAMA